MTKAFCPNCGTENEGTPGNRIACIACTATFEVPKDASWVGGQQTQPSAPKPLPVAPPPLSRPAPNYIGPPPSGFGQGSGMMGRSGSYNALAIASLVLGILCCAPFSIGAIVTGVIAQQQISRSGEKGRELAIAGIVLGSLSLAMNFIGIVTSFLGRH